MCQYILCIYKIYKKNKIKYGNKHVNKNNSIYVQTNSVYPAGLRDEFLKTIQNNTGHSGQR